MPCLPTKKWQCKQMVWVTESRELSMIELSLWLTYSTYNNVREKRKKTITKKINVCQLHNSLSVYAHSRDHAACGVNFWLLNCTDRGFETRWSREYSTLCLLCFGLVAASATAKYFFQRTPVKSVCDLDTSKRGDQCYHHVKDIRIVICFEGNVWG
jgi:hypothetical protein